MSARNQIHNLYLSKSSEGVLLTKEPSFQVPGLNNLGVKKWGKCQNPMNYPVRLMDYLLLYLLKEVGYSSQLPFEFHVMECLDSLG